MSDSATTQFEDDGWPDPFHAAIPGAKPPRATQDGPGRHPSEDCELIPDTYDQPQEATIVPVDPDTIATQWITASIHDLVTPHSMETTRVEPHEQDDTPTMFAWKRYGDYLEFTEASQANGQGILASTADTVEVRQ